MGSRQSTFVPFNRRSSSAELGRTAKVVHLSGKLREYGEGTTAGAVESVNPGYYLCSIEHMKVKDRVPRVPEGEELQPGEIYFLLPLARAQEKLSLRQLCELAVKASAALRYCGPCLRDK